MNTHTPGPWRIAGQTVHDYRIQADAAHEIICEASRSAGNGDANARLIAAAPDLLAACNAVIGQLNKHSRQWGQAAGALAFSRDSDTAVAFAALREAVAKATK